MRDERHSGLSSIVRKSGGGAISLSAKVPELTAGPDLKARIGVRTRRRPANWSRPSTRKRAERNVTTADRSKLKLICVADDPRWARVLARDKTADGQFWYSVTTTGSIAARRAPLAPQIPRTSRYTTRWRRPRPLASVHASGAIPTDFRSTTKTRSSSPRPAVSSRRTRSHPRSTSLRARSGEAPAISTAFSRPSPD